MSTGHKNMCYGRGCYMFIIMGWKYIVVYHTSINVYVDEVDVLI